jgi:predicted enzyme related to lactoylglutathione lyase
MAKAVGIGGVFLKARDPKALSEWYARHLGIPEQYGSLIFEGPEAAGTTVFAHFPADTKHFGEGNQPAMVNFRVDDLDALLAQLSEAGVKIDPKRDNADFGKFAWIWDAEGNRVELWEAEKTPSA